MRAQARATAELAAANLRKAEVLSDQAALSLFTMPNEERLFDEAREYLSLRRQEEMAKLRKRLVHERHEEAEAVAEAARLDRERAADLARAQRGHIPPPCCGDQYCPTRCLQQRRHNIRHCHLQRTVEVRGQFRVGFISTV